MATVTTSTITFATEWPAHTCLDRCSADSSLWICVMTAVNTVGVFKSTDGGLSWGSQGSFTQTSPALVHLGEMRFDSAGLNMHLNMICGDGTNDYVIYKRIPVTAGAADTSTGVKQVTKNANFGVNGGVYNNAAIWPQLNPDTSIHVIHAVSFQSTTSGAAFYCTLLAAGTYFTSTNDGAIYPTRIYALTTSDLLSVSLDAEHNGDGITSTNANLWAAFQIGTTAYYLKLAYQGYRSGWKTPTSPTIIAKSRASTRDFSARWDGVRYVGTLPNTTTASKLDVYERNQGNTSTTTRTTPTSHPQGTITNYTLAVNHVTRDFRLFAAGTTNLTVYYIDYIRLTATWGSWTQVSATAPTAGFWGVRRSTSGLSQFDFYMQTGTVTPWTISNVVNAVNFAPNAPTWVYGSGTTPAVNGAAFDVTSSLALDWAFNDPNATDTQGSFALSRQIGAAAIQYWRTSDSTWQVAEVQNTSATTALTLTTGQWVGAGGAADSAHVYKVKTWDAAGLPSSYSTGLSIIPSSRVDPTVTAPTASQVLNTGHVTATWTVAEQSAFRITITNVATGVVAYDTGFRSDATSLSYEVPYDMPDGFSGSLTLQTKNAEGLTSVTRTVAFSVDFTDPPYPIIGLTPSTVLGGIQYSYTQAAPVGTQPTVSTVDVYRRAVVTATPTNINPTFEVNATDWTNSNFTSAARSTAQAHTGTASLLCTPTGAAATPFVQTSSYTALPGSRWEGRVWFRPTVNTNAVRLYLMWYNVSSVLISSSTRDITAIAATWLYGYYAATAPPTTASVRLGIGYVGTPVNTNLLYVDDAQLFPANDDAGIRISAGVLASTTYLDDIAVSGVNYEYAGYTTATNATAALGPWVS